MMLSISEFLMVFCDIPAPPYPEEMEACYNYAAARLAAWFPTEVEGSVVVVNRVF
jgi:hypothetical protein